MTDSIDERTPLLQFPGTDDATHSHGLGDAYKQFCELIGSRPSDHPPGKPHNPPQDTLYRRATRHRKMQNLTYQFTAALTNTLLLTQVVLGAALTGLGASDQSRTLIVIFGALNTVIAGLVAFLKSRGQPMRARMFRDDLERVVDEIENSATMWLGISRGVHGYDEIDTDNAVTVRSEIARLTRLYDRAVKTNTMNDPDFYGGGGPVDAQSAGLRSRTDANVVLPAVPNPAPTGGQAGPVPLPTPAPVLGPAADPDESPATKAPTPPASSTKGDAKSDDGKGTDPAEDGKDKDAHPDKQDKDSSPKDQPKEPSADSEDKPNSSESKGKDPAHD